jgi:hypothetical protein
LSVDATNKSYYGLNSLHFVSGGNFSQQKMKIFSLFTLTLALFRFLFLPFVIIITTDFVTSILIIIVICRRRQTWQTASAQSASS